MIAAASLAACTGPTYYPAQPSGEGSYYIARSPGASRVTSYDVAYGYSAFAAYGIYPWWGYSYYSPYFYPHHFSIWQPGWPCCPDPYWAWHGGYPRGFWPAGHGGHGWPPRHPVTDAPGVAAPGIPAEPSAAGPGPGHAALSRELHLERERWRDSRWQARSASVRHRAEPMTRSFEPPGAAASIPISRDRSVPALPAARDRAVHSRDSLGQSPSRRDP